MFQLTEKEAAELMELGRVYGQLGRLFTDGDGDGDLFRIAARQVRAGADTLDAIASRLEVEGR